MPDDFKIKYGAGHARDPWRSIERQDQNNDSLHEALGALRKQHEETLLQLHAVRKEQLLEFFAEQGITTKFSSHNDALTWERDGAKILALPEGWSWDHEIKEELVRVRPWLSGPSADSALDGSLSVLRLFTPEGHELGKTSSFQSGHATQEPFRRREMLMASQRVLKQLLPEPRNEQPGPTGTFGGDE